MRYRMRHLFHPRRSTFTGLVSAWLLATLGAAAALAAPDPIDVREPPALAAGRAADPPGSRAALQPDSWEQFPLMIINVTPADVADLANLVDVVSYYSTFAPFEASADRSQAKADAISFRLDVQVEPMIAAAEAAGLHLTVTPALLAHPKALDDLDPLFTGDGEVHDGALYVDPAVVPGCAVPTDPACIRVPIHYDQITPEYVDYWAAKLPNFLQTVAGADPGGVVWGIYGAEEIRPWALEYGAQLRLRAALDADPAIAGRPLVSYSPHHRMPEHLAATLLAVPGVIAAPGALSVTTTPASPHSFSPVWSAASCTRIEPGCDVLGLADYYPLAQDFATTAGGELIPLQDHLMRGSYLGLLLGAGGHLQRIASIHRMNAQLEALAHVRNAYASNGQPAPDPLPFHLPDMNLCSLAEAQTSAAEARHDFWSGLHRGRGVFLYNYQFVVQAEQGAFTVNCPEGLPKPDQLLAVWEEYAHGLRLIKGSLREVILQGTSTYPVQFSSVNAAVTDTIAGTDYLIDNPIPGANATFAMPDYPVLHGSLHRVEPSAFLIVTSSYAQEVEFTVTFDEPICSVTVIHGDGDAVSFAEDDLSDVFSGIDGRVYHVELAEGESCP